MDLKATDNGTMTYTVMDQNLETNECSQVKSYVDIPIKKEKFTKVHLKQIQKVLQKRLRMSAEMK